jgi:protoheme IX farnesyltransferase
MFKRYYELSKPGIIYGNLVTAAAGFFLASRGHPNLLLLVLTLTGIGLIIGSGCVINNYLDRKIDAHMIRTRDRALVVGTISSRSALAYAAVIGLCGFGILILFTNLVTVTIGIIGLFSYALVYTFSKRLTVYSTLIGSISGSTSLIAGYCAVTGEFELGALALFIILSLWQMPHFYAIAIYRLDEYRAAHIPVLPVVKSVKRTKVHIVIYILAFIIATTLLTAIGLTGYLYLFIMLSAGLGWFRLAQRGFRAPNDAEWARQVFRYSLIILVIFSLTIGFSSYLL